MMQDEVTHAQIYERLLAVKTKVDTIDNRDFLGQSLGLMRLNGEK